MATIKLKNITSGYAKVGQLVRISPTNPNAFQYVTDLTKLDVIGTVANAGSPGSMCTINLMNEGSGGTGITISATAPTNPKAGDLWIDTSL
jgi:hypothetical protein